MTRRTKRRPAKARSFAGALLHWYDRNRRQLPWRFAAGETPDPYQVWLSEIMLQQTTVATVAPRFRSFLARWPDVAALAAAPLDQVLHEWQGLGYYERARNLHACARTLATEMSGRFPETPEALRALPGVGPYTANAIAAFAFGKKTVPLDANIERVLARLLALERPVREAKRELESHALTLLPERRAGDAAQALMELGAIVCTPRRPNCLICPVRSHCRAAAAGLAERLPLKARRPPRPLRHATLFWLERSDGKVWLSRWPERGLLGGLMGLPATPWSDRPWTLGTAIAHAPRPAGWRVVPGVVEWGFTHFRVALTILRGSMRGSRRPDAVGAWVLPAEFGAHALPTMMKRAIRHVHQAAPSGSCSGASGAARRSPAPVRRTRSARRSSRCRRGRPGRERPPGGSSPRSAPGARR
jgi:A/G-specific adenine glycosylase